MTGTGGFAAAGCKRATVGNRVRRARRCRIILWSPNQEAGSTAGVAAGYPRSGAALALLRCACFHWVTAVPATSTLLVTWESPIRSFRSHTGCCRRGFGSAAESLLPEAVSLTESNSCTRPTGHAMERALFPPAEIVVRLELRRQSMRYDVVAKQAADTERIRS